jgi:hypothetical protein
MVAHSSYGQCFHAIRTGDAAHVGPEFRLHLLGYQRPPFVRGKYVMDQDAGVGHRRVIVQSQSSLRDSCRGGIFTRHSASLRAGLTCRRACGTLLSNVCSLSYRAMPVDQVLFPENIHLRARGDFA